MTLPNFLIIGAMKAGTTALHHTLSQHPQIFMSAVKEPHFFSYEGRASSRDHIVTLLEVYEALFADAGDALARGEASPSYLPSPNAPDAIREHIPDAKLIAVLRDPVDRAYSHYLHLYKGERERREDFITAFHENTASAERRGNKWNTYLNHGLYARHLTRYFATFPREQIKIILYDDYIRDANAVLCELFTFLGVDPDFSAENRWYYKSGKPKSRAMNRLIGDKGSPLAALARAILPPSQRARLKTYLHNRNVVQEKLSADQRAALLPLFREDTLQLQAMIGRDLSKWLV